MSIFLPEVVKDIIYTYIHEIKTCERCDEDVVVHKKINQHYCSCGEFVCTNCYEEDLLYLQNSKQNNLIQCLCCYDDWDEMTDDEESIDEDAIWQEMYGIVCWSQIY